MLWLLATIASLGVLAASLLSMRKGTRRSRDLKDVWMRGLTEGRQASLPTPAEISVLIEAATSAAATAIVARLIGSRNTPLDSQFGPTVGSVYSVWYATNRRPYLHEGRVRYGAQIDRSIHTGLCEVFIPARRDMGTLGSSWWNRFTSGHDDRLKLHHIESLDQRLFWSAVQQYADSFKDNRHGLVYIHGYRVSFNSAALRAAQLGYDLGVAGPVSFFAWPSRATLLGYTADGSSVEASERAITDYLVDFARNAGVERVNVIAHSMGNRPLMRALQRILGNVEHRAPIQFSNIVLAAPDITRELFLDIAPHYLQLSRRTTLYVSQVDLALRASYRLQGPRVGLTPPVTCYPGIDTVQVGYVDRTFLGHSTYAESRALLCDMQALFTNELPPDRRPGLMSRLDSEGNQYWELRR